MVHSRRLEVFGVVVELEEYQGRKKIRKSKQFRDREDDDARETRVIRVDRIVHDVPNTTSSLRSPYFYFVK